MNPSQPAIDMFGEVARLAGIQELKMRLLANKTKAIQDSAYELHVFETNKKITAHFISLGKLTDENAKLLSKSQTIRNKILHCEFNVAVKKIEELMGARTQGPSVQVIKIDPSASGEDLLNNIFAAQAAIATGKKGPHQSASEMNDRDLGIFGGLISSAQTGAMKMAIEIFQRSNAVLDELMAIDTSL
jgi:hypothetical protein